MTHREVARALFPRLRAIYADRNTALTNDGGAAAALGIITAALEDVERETEVRVRREDRSEVEANVWRTAANYIEAALKSTTPVDSSDVRFMRAEADLCEERARAAGPQTQSGAPLPRGEVAERWEHGRKAITKAAYEKLIVEDIAWVEQFPRTLKREHVVRLLRYSVDALYPPAAAPPSKTPATEPRRAAMAREAGVDVSETPPCGSAIGRGFCALPAGHGGAGHDDGGASGPVTRYSLSETPPGKCGCLCHGRSDHDCDPCIQKSCTGGSPAPTGKP